MTWIKSKLMHDNMIIISVISMENLLIVDMDKLGLVLF